MDLQELEKISQTVKDLKGYLKEAKKVIENIELQFNLYDMERLKLEFKGKFLEFFLVNIFLLIATTFTCGFLFPFYVWWTVKYFIENTEIIRYDK